MRQGWQLLGFSLVLCAVPDSYSIVVESFSGLVKSLSGFIKGVSGFRLVAALVVVVLLFSDQLTNHYNHHSKNTKQETPFTKSETSLQPQR